MKTKELVNFLECGKMLGVLGEEIERNDVINEIIQRLREYDELKKVIHDTVDSGIELYNYLLAVSGESKT